MLRDKVRSQISRFWCFSSTHEPASLCPPLAASIFLLPSLAFWAHVLLLHLRPPPLDDVLARGKKITFCSCRSWKGIGPETSPGIKASCFVSPPLHSTGESSSSSPSSSSLYFLLFLPSAGHPPAPTSRWDRIKICGWKWERVFTLEHFISSFFGWLRDLSFSNPFPSSSVSSFHVSLFYFHYSQPLFFICTTWAPVK